MRLEIKEEITLSEDEISSPIDVRFKSEKTVTESAGTLIKHARSTSEDIAASTVDYTLDLGKITQGHWFYIIGDADFDLKINGGSAIKVNANKPVNAWLQFTDLKVSEINGATLRISYALGGA